MSLQTRLLENASCRDVMELPGEAIDPDSTCTRALETMVNTRRRFVAVLLSGKLVGLVTLSDFARLKGKDPARTLVGAITTYAKDLLTLAPAVLAVDAFQMLETSGYHQIPVVSAGRKLEGFITRETAMSAGAWRK